MVTDESGRVIERVQYRPFGEVYQREILNPATGQLIAVNEASRISPFGYTGQRHDTTGLYFYGGRYYDPQLGRFISPDPFVQAPTDPQTLNRYTYVRNNPVNNVDPSGYSFWKGFKRVYIALVTFGMSETIPATTKAIVHLSGQAGVDPRYALALYSAVIGAATGGIGWGLSAAVSGAMTAGATSLAMASGEGRQITQKVAKEFFIDVVGMSPQAAYTAASITVSTAIATSIQLLGSAANYMRKTAWEQSTINPRNATKASAGFKGDGHGLAGSRWDTSKLDGGSSPLGGRQGGPGKFFGINYTEGSGLDLTLEIFAGPHDYLNSPWVYDASGNIRQGMTAFEKAVGGVMNWIDVPLSVPFGVAGAVAPEGTAGIAGTGLLVDHSKHRE